MEKSRTCIIKNINNMIQNLYTRSSLRTHINDMYYATGLVRTRNPKPQRALR